MNNLQKENRNYDVRLDWILTFNCNLNCDYCLQYFFKEKGILTEKISKIKISALIKTLNETGKTFRINFTGGEPFLIPNIIEACMEITKNHFISFITNLTSEKIKDFVEKIDPERVIDIAASLHIKTLEKFNLLDKFINNFQLCKEKGFFIVAIEVAHPHLLDEVEKYKKFFQEKGVYIVFLPFIGKYNGKYYPASYTMKEIKIFGLDKKYIDKQFQKGKLCNAGYNLCAVYPNGDIQYCYQMLKFVGNIYKKIKLNDKLIRCPFDFCMCLIKEYSDGYLFKKAIKETKLNVEIPFFFNENVLKIYIERHGKKFLTSHVRKQINVFFRKHNLLVSFFTKLFPSLNQSKVITLLINLVLRINRKKNYD